MGDPVRFGLVGPSYQSENLSVDNQACINFYPSVDESGAGNSPIWLANTPGTKLFVNLGRTISPAVDGLLSFDQATGANATGTAVATGSKTPSSTPEWALFGFSKDDLSGFTFTPAAGWSLLDSQTYQQIVNGPINGQGTISSSTDWAAALMLFKIVGSSAPALAQTPKGVASGTFNGTNSTHFTNPVTAGNAILVILEGNQVVTGNSGFTFSDGVNTYTKIVDVNSGINNGPTYTAYLATNIAAGTPTLSGTVTHFVSGQIVAYEIVGGANAVVNSGPIRGQLEIAGRAFVVCGQDFDEVMANGTFTTWGQVSNDSLPVTMAASPQQLLLASAGNAYVFDLMANTLTMIPGVTFDGPVSQAGICDDFFLLTIQNSKEFYVSAPLDATDWVTNGSAIVSVFPDNIVSMFVFQRQPWFFSDTQSVVYYDSGNIFPFDVNPNAFIEAGCAAENSVAQMNNAPFWLGADARGHGKVWTAAGYTPQRVSTHALEFAIQGYSRIDDAVAWTAQFEGHDFYNIYFPTPSVTWVYDAATGMWHQEAFEIALTGQFQAAHRWNHMFVFGMHLVGDWQSGKVYQMQIPTPSGSTWTFGDDDGAPIVRIRRAPHISKAQRRQYFNELQLLVQSGLGPIPPLKTPSGLPRGPIVSMRFSNDNGQTWSNSLDRDTGMAGQFQKRVRWLRLGEARDRIFEIRYSDPVPLRITDAYLDYDEAVN